MTIRFRNIDKATKCNSGIVQSHKAEVGSFVAWRSSEYERRAKYGIATITSSTSFVDWSRLVEGRQRYEHLPNPRYAFDVWRYGKYVEARLAVERIRSTVEDVERMKVRPMYRRLVERNGRVHYERLDGATQSERAMQLSLVEARRRAKGLRRAMLRNDYRGSSTSDGMTGSRSTSSTFRKLDRAIALSDTFITLDGVTSVALARGLRYDDGTFDGIGNLANARTRHER